MYEIIEMGGKTRRLRYDFNALADIEAKADRGIGALFSEQRMGFHSIRLLLWGGLKWADRALTLERVGAMIGNYVQGGGSLEDLMETVMAAVEKSGVLNFKEVEEVEEVDEADPEGDQEEGNLEAEVS